MTDESKGRIEQTLLYVIVIVPFLALLGAIAVAWGWGISWLDVGLAAAFYLVSGLGVTVGFHRYFTHGGFKAKRWLRLTLRGRRLAVRRGRRDPLGRRPPPAPRLQRQGGRPALALALRRDRSRRC
jgi:fatty-acid desaturase